MIVIQFSHLTDKIVWVLTCIFLSSITIFESTSWGRYVLIATCGLIFLIDLFSGKIHFTVEKFQIYLFIMTFYTLLSSFWAIDASDTIMRGLTLIQILICMWVFYNHYSKFETVGPLLSAIKWSSFVISAYALYFYGLTSLTVMAQLDTRLESDFANVNNLGMLASIGILIQLDEIAHSKRNIFSLLFSIPSWILLMGVQSKKAIVMLILGSFLLYLFRNITSKNIIKNIIIIIIGLCGVYLIINQLSDLDMFAGIVKRFERVFNFFSGEGITDNSSVMRALMIQLGIKIFIDHPILGIGMNNTHIINANELFFDAYLHDNFVELLAGGGIIGFSIYYSAYVYLFGNFRRYSKFKDNYFFICLVLMILFLLRDAAMVSWYSKDTYFYFMMLFLVVKKMKIRAKIYSRNIEVSK